MGRYRYKESKKFPSLQKTLLCFLHGTWPVYMIPEAPFIIKEWNKVGPG